MINKWQQDSRKFKLLPTQADRDAYMSCINAVHSDASDNVSAAYAFFTTQLAELGGVDEAPSVAELENAAISGLSIVSVTAHAAENSYRIFESLNNTGVGLTQADLLRNYVFMRLPTLGQEVYDGLWLPMQKQLGDPQSLELLFWLDLVQRDPKVRQSEVYQHQQRRLDHMTSESEIRAEIERFARLAKLLHRILHPAGEESSSVRERLVHLGGWGSKTVFPVVLHLLDRRDRGEVTSEAVAEAMLYLESFLVRRLLIGEATNNINRILLAAVSGISGEPDVATALRRYLSTGQKRFASDAAVGRAVWSEPFYLNGKPQQRKLILQWLEESYGTKEPVDPASLTIEHLLPQTPSAEWRAEFADDLAEHEDFDVVRQGLVHTLGNLTLTGYNSTLSNSPFAKKRELLAQSGLKMNQQIAQAQRWDRSAIHQRSQTLAERICQTWPGPVGDVDDETTGSVRWDLLTKAVTSMPTGAWTSYGDLAQLLGTHPVPVGNWIARHPMVNGHRVLQSSGTLSPGFQWYDPSRTDDPIQVLSAEGIIFNEKGQALPRQRLSAEDLARLL